MVPHDLHTAGMPDRRRYVTVQIDVENPQLLSQL